MKKLTLLLAIIGLFVSSNLVFAEMFDNLTDLQPEQKIRLTHIYQEYKQENNELENRIMQYSNKINQLKTDTDKTPEQVSLLTGAYERNVETLKAQQKLLEKTTNELYKQVMTPEQFLQFSSQSMQVQSAFDKFLQK